MTTGPYCSNCGGNAESGHAPGCTVTRFADTHIGPDCRDGKHRACHGDAWCFVEDGRTDCECPCHKEARSA